jgi:protein-S-isoprenylcysteine O-methyltransferase Ste14
MAALMDASEPVAEMTMLLDEYEGRVRALRPGTFSAVRCRILMIQLGGDERDARWNRTLKTWAAMTGVTWLVGPFVLAGTLDFPGMWIALGTIASGALVQRMYVSRRNPEILLRRKGIGPGTKGWDIAVMFVAGPLAVLPPLVAGQGIRSGWTPMPWTFALIGVALNTLGGVVWARSMASNAHFEPSVRIQRELGHRVVESGPYGVVRHPGYAGYCIGILGTPFLLLSWQALLVAPLLAVLFVVRAALEDATLRRELVGYADYAERVRYRLVPGVW